jgi:hypothetical protein
VTPRTTLFAALAAALFLIGVLLVLRNRETAPAQVAAEPRLPVRPAPIDAAQIATGRLPMERLPLEVGKTLEAHEEEIVRSAELIESRQARITGSCAPGSAIRVVAPDGSVSCQKLPKGIVSVTSLAGIPLSSATTTAQESVPGGVGRYQTGGDDDFLVVPVALPDGATINSFEFVFYDNATGLDGSAHLYRSDGEAMAIVPTDGASTNVRSKATERIRHRKVDAARYAYFVYFQVSARAGADLLPISASLTYRLP